MPSGLGPAGERRGCRSRITTPQGVLVRVECDDLTFDSDTRQLWRRGKEVALSPKAFELLALLIARRPNAVSKADIRAHLWPDTFVSDSNLPSLVSEIREAIADRRRKPALLRTLHGFGYAFHGDAPPPHALDSDAPNGWLIGTAAEVALFEGENVIGREGEGVILVKSSTVSRRHARIQVDGTGGTVEDLGSKNGTYVNDRRVDGPTPVADGDQVRIGSLLFTFRRPQPAQSTETLSSRSGRRSPS
jgi:DNA-binding winged helix-turn-helix (wHTH) protein